MDLLSTEKLFPTPFADSPLLPLLLMTLLGQKNSPNTAKTVKTEYDYIIVGAGSAGSVLANRLSEKPCVSVLVLEAGGPPPVLTEIPAIERFFWYTDIDWSYKTVPQKYTGRGLKERQFIYPSGKALGGSSVLNDVQAIRGNMKNYDDWEAMGAEGWGYDDVLPYFKKLEDNRDQEYVANGYHGVGGPQTVHKPHYTPEFKPPLFEAAQELGYKIVDPNGPRQTGFYDLQGILRSGQLCSTAKAYLVPADNRTNLDILPRAMVRKVLIKNRIAIGVEFDFQGKTYTVKARKEVILSAGTLHTPKLLMLSGIGPREELERLKIPVIADLPGVGKNFQDHVGSTESFLMNPDIPEVTLKLLNPLNIIQYLKSRTGPLAAAQLVIALQFGQTPHGPHPRQDFPNYQIYFVEATTLLPLLDFGMKPEVFEQVYGPYQGKPFYLCLVHLLQPRSRGTVTLASTDPYDDPVIDPNFYEDPDDIQDVVEGLKTCAKIGRSQAMKKVGSYRFNTTYPGCEKYVGNEDEYYACQVRSVSVGYFHEVGTSKMGSPDDPTTVVDPQLRVKTIKGLRVIDASVMPIIPSGNTNLPTIMIAEKASDMLKQTICCQGSKQNPDLTSDDSSTPDEDDRPQCDTDEPPDQDTDQQVTPWNKELKSSSIQSRVLAAVKDVASSLLSPVLPG